MGMNEKENFELLEIMPFYICYLLLLPREK